MTSPFTLPSDLVDAGRREREESVLSSWASSTDKLVSEGMGALKRVAGGVAEQLSPFAQALSEGGLKVPTLDDLISPTNDASMRVRDEYERARQAASTAIAMPTAPQQSDVTMTTGRTPLPAGASIGPADASGRVGSAPSGGYAPSTARGDDGVEQWSPIISEAARQYNVPEAVVKGIMTIESGGNPGAVSAAGALGLMQTMPFHYRDGEDGMDPRTNIMRGTKILADNYARYGDWDRAAAAYFGAIDGNGNITDATDATGTNGSKYVALFRGAANKYGGIPGSAPSVNAAPPAASAAPPSAPPAPVASSPPQPDAGGSDRLTVRNKRTGLTSTISQDGWNDTTNKDDFEIVGPQAMSAPALSLKAGGMDMGYGGQSQQSPELQQLLAGTDTSAQQPSMLRGPLQQAPAEATPSEPQPPARDDWRNDQPMPQPIEATGSAEVAPQGVASQPTYEAVGAGPTSEPPQPGFTRQPNPASQYVEMPVAQPVAAQSDEPLTLDQSIPSPPGWSALVNAAGQVVQWVQDTASSAVTAVQSAGQSALNAVPVPDPARVQANIERTMAGQPIEMRGDVDRRMQESSHTVADPVNAAAEQAATSVEQAIGAPAGSVYQAAQDVSNVLGPEGPMIAAMRPSVAARAARTAETAAQEASPGVVSRIRSALDANAERVAAADARAAESGGTAVNAALGSLPEPPRGPKTVEQIQDQIAHTRRVLADIDPQAEPELAQMVRDRDARLQNDLYDAQRARQNLEPAITSDQGRRIEEAPVDVRSAEDAMRARFPDERVRANQNDLSGPVSIPTQAPSTRLNAGFGVVPDEPHYTPATSAGEMVSRIRDVEMVPPRAMLEIIGDRPEYLNDVADFMLEQRAKVSQGRMTPRDVAKAYYMTVASQGSDAISRRIVESKVRGFKIPDEFLVDPTGARDLVRPEEAAAAWLASPNGKRALDAIEQGRFIPELWAEGSAVRRAFGDDRFRTTNVFSERAPINPRRQFNMTNVADFTEAFNRAAQAGDLAEVDRLSNRLNGVGAGKLGFIKHALGFGETPTIDAVEINAWLTGRGETGKMQTPAADMVRDIRTWLKDRSVGEALRERITNAFDEMNAQMTPEQKAGLPDEIFNHVLHHWIWDRMKGTATTHQGFYDAMRHAVTAGVLPPSSPGPDRLAAVNRVLGQGLVSAASGGTAAAAAEQLGDPNDPYRGAKAFVAGAVAPALLTRGAGRLARSAGREAEGAGGLRAALGHVPEEAPRPERIPNISDAPNRPRNLGDIPPSQIKEPTFEGFEAPPRPYEQVGPMAQSDAPSRPRSLADILANPERDVELPGMPQGGRREPTIGLDDPGDAAARAEMRRGGDALPGMEGLARDRFAPVREATMPADATQAANEMRATNSPALPEMHPGVIQRIRKRLEPWIERSNTLRYAGMLSDTAGHAQNIESNLVLQAADILSSPIMATMDAGRAAVTGKPRQVFFHEIPARLAGMRAGARAGLEEARSIMRTGVKPDEVTKLEQQGGKGFNSGNKIVDAAIEAPLRALAAADAIFRGAAVGGHGAAEAYAAARKLNGGRPPSPEQIAAAMHDPKVRATIEELSARSVLQEDRRMTAWWRDSMKNAPPEVRAVASVEMPFVRTPYNVMAQGMGMTPAGLIGTVEDIAKGRSSREVERRLSRVAMGTAVMGLAAADYGAGNMTGPYPTDPKEASTLPPGWKPWSRKFEVGGETYYVPLAVLGPLAVPAVIAILSGETVKQGKDALSLDWAGKVAMGLGQFAEQNTFFEGFGAISKIFDDRTGEANIQRQLESTVAQFSPHIVGGGALGREIQRIMDMPSGDPDGILQALLEPMPYGSKVSEALGAGEIRPRQDVLGREQSRGISGPAAALVRGGKEDDSPVIAAFRRAGQALPQSAPKSLIDPTTKQAIRLTEDQRATWERAFGRAVQQQWGNTGYASDAKSLDAAATKAREDARRQVIGR